MYQKEKTTVIYVRSALVGCHGKGIQSKEKTQKEHMIKRTNKDISGSNFQGGMRCNDIRYHSISIAHSFTLGGMEGKAGKGPSDQADNLIVKHCFKDVLKMFQVHKIMAAGKFAASGADTEHPEHPEHAAEPRLPPAST